MIEKFAMVVAFVAILFLFMGDIISSLFTGIVSLLLFILKVMEVRK